MTELVLRNVKIYLVGFAIIVGLTSFFNLIMGIMCIRKCKRKFCNKKKKSKGKNNKKGKEDTQDDGSLEMEEMPKRGSKALN
jgi:hypothetical protein